LFSASPPEEVLSSSWLALIAAASPPLASWSTSLAATFPLWTLDSVEFRFDRFPPSFPTELVLPPEIEPDVAAPVLDVAV
jgi:hypothetical protein